MNLEGSFTLIALMDGTTINGTLRVEGTPLVQRYNKGTVVFIPDYPKTAVRLSLLFCVIFLTVAFLYPIRLSIVTMTCY